MRMDHINIAKCYGWSYDRAGIIYGVFEEGGIAMDMLITSKPSRKYDDFFMPFLFQVAHALNYLHHKIGIVHGDIKLGNIVVNLHTSVFKLIDFGIAHKINQPRNNICGTTGYIAPEFREAPNICTEKTDIWSLGKVCIKYWGDIPLTPDEFNNFTKERYDWIFSVRKRKYPNIFNIIEQMLEYEADNRISSRSLVRYVNELAGLYPHIMDDMIQLYKAKGIYDPF